MVSLYFWHHFIMFSQHHQQKQGKLRLCWNKEKQCPFYFGTLILIDLVIQQIYPRSVLLYNWHCMKLPMRKNRIFMFFFICRLCLRLYNDKAQFKYWEKIHLLWDTEKNRGWIYKLNQMKVLDKTFSPWSYLPCGKDFKPHFQKKVFETQCTVNGFAKNQISAHCSQLQCKKYELNLVATTACSWL